MDNVFDIADSKYNQGKKEAEEKKNKKYSFADYEQVEWEGLKDNGDVVFRIIGVPVEVRQKNTDPQKIFFSKVLKDGGKGYINVIWKQNEAGELDSTWILKRFYDAIMTSTWVKYVEADIDNVNIKKVEDKILNTKGHNGYYQRVYSDKPSFVRVDQNLKVDASEMDKKFLKRFYPSQRYLMNIISRMDDWCKENKHSKMLSSKHELGKKADKEGKFNYFSDYGVTKQVYEQIMEQVVHYRKNWSLDVVVSKDSKAQTKYSTRDIREEKIDPKTKALGTDAQLTEEELAYELYDVDKFSTHSSYNKLKKNLIGLFNQGDIDLGLAGTTGSFSDELKRLADKEEAERSKDQVKDNTDDMVDAIENDDQPIDEEEQPTKKARVKSSVDSGLLELCKKNFPAWDKVPEEEAKNVIKQLDKFNGSVPVWKNRDMVGTCTKADCKYKDSTIATEYPLTGVVCPVCGTVDTSGN